MGRLLVVDGSAVCRAPIVAITLADQLRRTMQLRDFRIETRGVSAQPGHPMCEGAAGRIGFSAPAVAFFGSHRSAPLSETDIASAELVLTAERTQRSAVARMLPGSQTRVFTGKEALVLIEVLLDRRGSAALPSPEDLPARTRGLHGARGIVPLIEPEVRAGLLHWGRAGSNDPLSVADSHDRMAEHRRITKESADIALGLAAGFARLTDQHDGTAGSVALPQRRWFHRSA